MITEICQQTAAMLMLMSSIYIVQHGGLANKKQTSVCVFV